MKWHLNTSYLVLRLGSRRRDQSPLKRRILRKEFGKFAALVIRHGFEGFSDFRTRKFFGRSRGGSRCCLGCFSNTGTRSAGGVGASFLLNRAFSREMALFFAIEATSFAYEAFAIRVRGTIGLGSSDVYIHSIRITLWAWGWARWLLRTTLLLLSSCITK
jgi:hypothetical protein